MSVSITARSWAVVPARVDRTQSELRAPLDPDVEGGELGSELNKPTTMKISRGGGKWAADPRSARAALSGRLSQAS